MEIKRLIDSIHPVDKTLLHGIRAHLNSLTKPPGSLGMLELLAERCCLIQSTTRPAIGGKLIAVFAADHGVSREMVSAYPREVTALMAKNIAAGGAAVNVLARHAGAEVVVVDVGIDGNVSGQGILGRKVRSGAENIAEGPAMTPADAVRAVLTGVEIADDAVRQGTTLLGTGEMGIGNTTSSSAIFAALLPCKVDEITGRGTGVSDEIFERKKAVIKRALAVNKDRLTGPLETLSALGGFEIAALCGFILGGCARKRPVVIDGFISTAAALVAYRLQPAVLDYLFFSHCSAEAGHAQFFLKENLRPILNLNMRLGEGTGAALAMNIIEASVKMYNEMATFESAGIAGKEE